jgi:hypothetical protein
VAGNFCWVGGTAGFVACSVVGFRTSRPVPCFLSLRCPRSHLLCVRGRSCCALSVARGIERGAGASVRWLVSVIWEFEFSSACGFSWRLIARGRPLAGGLVSCGECARLRGPCLHIRARRGGCRAERATTVSWAPGGEFGGRCLLGRVNNTGRGEAPWWWAGTSRARAPRGC